MLGRFRGPETAALHFLIIADCPSYLAVHRRRSGLPCCRRSHLEQSASTRHVRILYACFPRTLEGFSLQAFLSMTRYLNFCSACAVTRHFRTLKSFFLLTYLLSQRSGLLLERRLYVSQTRGQQRFAVS